MVDETTPLRGKLKQLRRQAIESLLDGEHLRYALTDAEAQELLDWALARVAGSPGLGNPERSGVEMKMEEWVTAVTAVMRRVNLLVESLATLDDDEAAYQVNKLTGNLQRIANISPDASSPDASSPDAPSPDAPSPDAPSPGLLSAERANWSHEEIFRRLMTLITQPQDVES